MFFAKRSGGVEWIIAFLGNPGPEYENTRHNAGFLAGAAMEKLLGVKMTRVRHRSLTARADQLPSLLGVLRFLMTFSAPVGHISTHLWQFTHFSSAMSHLPSSVFL